MIVISNYAIFNILKSALCRESRNLFNIFFEYEITESTVITILFSRNLVLLYFLL